MMRKMLMGMVLTATLLLGGMLFVPLVNAVEGAAELGLASSNAGKPSEAAPEAVQAEAPSDTGKPAEAAPEAVQAKAPSDTGKPAEAAPEAVQEKVSSDVGKRVKTAPKTVGIADWEEQAPLQRFTSSDQGRFLFLRQTQASHAFQITVPYRVAASSMLVHLEFTNSNALLANRSQIVLRINGGVFAQAHLDPIFPDSSVDVRVPLTSLKSGRNTLTVEVAQHYLMECEDPGSPELWTSIDTQKSYVKLTGQLKPIQEQFSEVDRVLSGSGWKPQDITLFYTNTDKDHLHAGTLISQGLALKNKEQTTMIHSKLLDDVSNGLQQTQGDVVIFGTREELEKYIQLPIAKNDALGQMFIQARADDPTHFVLGVVSSTPTGMTQIAKAFAWSSAPIQALDVVQVYNVQAPTEKSYTSHVAVVEGYEYKLSQLAYTTTTLKGLVDQTHFDVWIPADLFAESHMNIEMKLHFSYGASLRADSVLNMFHNGKFIRGISLADQRGLSIADYLIRVPLASMKPGLNRFEFQSRMYAYTPSNCTTGNTENLLFTLFDDSTISIPDTSRFVAMPEINLFTETAFPYAGRSAKESLIQVTTLSDAMLGSAWTLAARLAKIREGVIEPLTVSLDAAGYKNVIRLSTIHEIPASWWEKAPINLGDKGFINHPTLANPDILGDKIGTWRLKFARLLDASVSDAPAYLKESQYTRIRQDVKLLNAAALLQMENPEYPSGTLTLIVSDTEDELERAIQRLSVLWGDLSSVHGDLLIWGVSTKQGQGDYWSASLHQRHYHIGTMPRWQRLSYFAIQYPGFLATLLFIMFMTMALITRWGLLLYRRKEHPGIEP
ncbi:MAG: cellulose biosynthesis cyclic di-GMP-binding regulatory protein BcsB [Mariprofundaceae bacterium]|nr:cellulose biosynthesis cyclic di-GMP-binding regulatory protein BcsB [Mariprofundaceae bacterium]